MTLEEEIKFNFYTNPKNKKKLLYLSQEEIDYYMSFYSESNKKLKSSQVKHQTKLLSDNNWRFQWRQYKRECYKITKQQPIETLKHYDKRVTQLHISKIGFTNCMKSETLYTLDHKISIWYGFKNNIDYNIIGHINNLEYIPAKQNSLKGTKCNFSPHSILE